MKLMNFIIIACAALIVGCASVPPPELVSARQAYQHASSGQAAQLVPADLHKAEVALAAAEKSFQDDPKSFVTRDLAYVADRKAKLAEALATTAAGNLATAKANKDYEATQSQIVKNTKEDLAASQRAQESSKVAADAARLKATNVAEAQRVQDSTNAAAKAAGLKAANVAETRRVQDSTNAASEAARLKAANIAEAQRTKDLTDAEARRLNTIIVLEKGKKVILKGVNFEFNKSTLTNNSETILTMAYNALIANPGVQVEISGHTDNVGSQKSNQVLSLERAQAVRNWLVQKGIASNRMKAVGKGQNEPVATNTTDAGRAENRRIEFYVQK
jgi:outer membrane protein OmpA-like peptidoglycan-associated protein